MFYPGTECGSECAVSTALLIRQQMVDPGTDIDDNWRDRHITKGLGKYVMAQLGPCPVTLEQQAAQRILRSACVDT